MRLLFPKSEIKKIKMNMKKINNLLKDLTIMRKIRSAIFVPKTKG